MQEKVEKKVAELIRNLKMQIKAEGINQENFQGIMMYCCYTAVCCTIYYGAGDFKKGRIEAYENKVEIPCELEDFKRFIEECKASDGKWIVSKNTDFLGHKFCYRMESF